MGQRSWFTPVRSPIASQGLTQSDCAILNRAARNLFAIGGPPPTHLQLMEIRMAYTPGMSARELMEKIEDP